MTDYQAGSVPYFARESESMSVISPLLEVSSLGTERKRKVELFLS
jgi:hypothetical protein